jgi:trk/ktr system potassium uptake protein
VTYSTVLHAMGWLILLLAGAAVLPWATALFAGEQKSFVAFSITCLLAAFTGGALVMAFRGVARRTSKSDLFLLVVGVWLLVPLFGAIPLVVSGALPSPSDAYFEAMSGFTTTGASVIPSLDEVDRAILVWRAVLQWLGGWASIVMGAAVLAPLGIGGMELRVSPLTRADRSQTLDRFKGTAEAVAGIYLTFTAIGFLFLWAGGIPPFDAFCLALSSISTGGFTTTDAGLSTFNAPWSMVFLSILAIIGAVSFATHRAASKGRVDEYREDPEVGYLLTIVLGAGILLGIAALQDTGDVLSAFSVGLFSAISLATTTAFVAPDQSTLSGISPIFVICIVLMGGATLSTAGGIKLMRVALLVKQSEREIKRLVHPNGIIATKFAGRPVGIQIMKSVWTFFILLLFAYAVLAVLLSATGLEIESAMVAAAAAIGNAGPAYDLVRLGEEGTVPSYAEFSLIAKWLLMIGMVIGRLELLAFVALFSFENWRN